jgi:hypothetical protein
LKLIDKYDSIDKNKLWINKEIAYKEKIPLIYKFSKKDINKVLVFDGKKIKSIIKDKFLFKKNHPITCSYIFVKLDDKCKKEYIKSLQQIYADFIADADFLKEATKGKINMYKIGSYKKTALKLFRNLNSTIQLEQIK